MLAVLFVIVSPGAQSNYISDKGQQSPLVHGGAVTRQQEQMILRLWRDWCRLWPEHYGHDSLQVKPQGYDPVFDVIPCQTYKDFYLEVVRGHPTLKNLNVFEVIDTALNQVRAPEQDVVQAKARAAENAGPGRANDHPRVTEVELITELPDAQDDLFGDKAGTA